MAELNPIDFIKNAIKEIGQGNAQFKKTADQNTNSLTSIIKDITKFFSSNSRSQGDINESLGSLSQSSMLTSQKIDQTNNLLNQSITIENQVVNELKRISATLAEILEYTIDNQNNQNDQNQENNSGANGSQGNFANFGPAAGLFQSLMGEITSRFVPGFNQLLGDIPGSPGPTLPPAASGGPSGTPTPVNATSEGDGSSEQGGVSNQIGSVSSKGNLKDRKGFIIHHTGGRGDVGGVVNTLNQRGLSVQYVIDREGQIHQLLPSGARASHMRKGQGVGEGLSNSNTEGVEIIARDDSDVLPVQVEAAKKLISQLGYSPSQVYGHGEVNSHKQKTEGATVVSAVRGGSPPAGAGESQSATGSTGLSGGAGGNTGGGGAGGGFGGGDISGILSMLGPAAGLGGALFGAMNMMSGGFGNLLGMLGMMIPGLGGLGGLGGMMNMASGGGGGGGSSKGGSSGGGFSDTGGAGKLSVAEMTNLAKEAGFNDEQAAIMGAIGAAESGGNPNAHNPNASTGDNSYGLWQINMLGKMEGERKQLFGIQDNEQLKDPKTNAMAAKKIFDQQGFNAWSVYKSGAYSKFLGTANKNTQVASIQASDEKEDFLDAKNPASYAKVNSLPNVTNFSPVVSEISNALASPFTPVNVSSEEPSVSEQIQTASIQPRAANFIQETAVENETMRVNSLAPQPTQSIQPVDQQPPRVSNFNRDGEPSSHPRYSAVSPWYAQLAGKIHYNDVMKFKGGIFQT